MAARAFRVYDRNTGLPKEQYWPSGERIVFNDAGFAFNPGIPSASSGGGLLGEIAKLDPTTAISREVTNVLQPVEKAVSTGLADVDKNLSLSKNAPVIAAVALAVVVPVIGAEVGASLMEAGYLTSAANASNAVLAAGGTAAQAAAAAASATATATAVGTAIASATAQVAQGVPVEDAIKNATVAATVQLNAPGAVKTVNDIVGKPAVTNLVVSTAASVVQTAATGGNEADIIRNAKGALVGSVVTSATGSNVVGRTAGGGVTGGVTGALMGAAGAIGSDLAKPTGTTTTNISGVDPGVQVAGGDDASALNLASISAMPEMLGKAGETSSQISASTDSDGITTYRRSITGTTPDGKPYSYTAIYVPDAPQGKQFAYETVSSGTPIVSASTGEMIEENPVGVVRSSYKRPDFTATDTTKTGGTVAGEGLVVLGDKTATAGGSSVSPADQKVLDLIKPTPEQATVPALKTFTPATFTPATAPGRGVETDEERIARLDAQTARVIAQEADYTTRSRPRTTEQAVIDLTGIGGANVGGNVVVGPGADAGAGNATGNVIVADAGGGNAAGNVIVGPGDEGGGLGGNVTIDVGGGGNATSNVSGNVVVDEPPDEEDKPPAEEEKPPEEEEPPEEEDKPPSEKEDKFKPDLFIYGGKKLPRRPRPELGTTLQEPFAPSTTLGQALTGYRGAGEIEGKKTGKPRRDVWNEESLRLKDALGL